MPRKSKEQLRLEAEQAKLEEEKQQKERRRHMREYRKFRADLAFANEDAAAYILLTQKFPPQPGWIDTDDVEEEIRDLEEEIETAEDLGYFAFQKKLNRITSLKKKLAKAEGQEEREEEIEQQCEERYKAEKAKLQFEHDPTRRKYHGLLKSFHDYDIEGKETNRLLKALPYLSGLNNDTLTLPWFDPMTQFKAGHYLMGYDKFLLYIAWRTKVRQKKRVVLYDDYVRCYLYELLNFVEYDSVEDTNVALQDFLASYKIKETINCSVGLFQEDYKLETIVKAFFSLYGTNDEAVSYLKNSETEHAIAVDEVLHGNFEHAAVAMSAFPFMLGKGILSTKGYTNFVSEHFPRYWRLMHDYFKERDIDITEYLVGNTELTDWSVESEGDDGDCFLTWDFVAIQPEKVIEKNIKTEHGTTAFIVKPTKTQVLKTGKLRPKAMDVATLTIGYFENAVREIAGIAPLIISPSRLDWISKKDPVTERIAAIVTSEEFIQYAKETAQKVF